MCGTCCQRGFDQGSVRLGGMCQGAAVGQRRRLLRRRVSRHASIIKPQGDCPMSRGSRALSGNMSAKGGEGSQVVGARLRRRLQNLPPCRSRLGRGRQVEIAELWIQDVLQQDRRYGARCCTDTCRLGMRRCTGDPQPLMGWGRGENNSAAALHLHHEVLDCISCICLHRGRVKRRVHQQHSALYGFKRRCSRTAH